MKESEIDYDCIREWLDRVQCPIRLYPEIVAALDIFLTKDFSSEIHARIESRIGQHVGPGWGNQFTRDFETYGLYEAILYFHSFPFTIAATDFIKQACDLYCEIASEYLEHQQQIEETDDPRVHAKLSLREFRGSLTHHVTKFRRAPLDEPARIQPPQRPPDNPRYRRRLPINRDMLLNFQGVEIGQPGNAVDEVIEHLDARFMFSDFPGIQLVIFEIANVLNQFEIDPFSAAGQYVLQEIIEHMETEYYGDFDRWINCFNCDEDFMPEITLASANLNLVHGGWACEECRKSLTVPQYA